MKVVQTPPSAKNAQLDRNLHSPQSGLNWQTANGPARKITEMVKLFLAGDVMIGRGIDQILRHPADPVISEPYVKSATGYVTLAERASGPIPRGVEDQYVWGDVITELDRAAPDVRIINLETAVTARGKPLSSRGISYRMHTENIGVLNAARIDVCSLANNHVLDWSYEGLEDTLDALDHAGILVVGAGLDRPVAEASAVISVNGSRVLVFGVGSVALAAVEMQAVGALHV